MKPQRTFSADVGQTSVDNRGPDAIERDIDTINKMFDPAATHTGGESGGIKKVNLAQEVIDLGGAVKKEGAGYTLDNGSPRATLGLNAIDFSTTEGGDLGAQGEESFCTGESTAASGIASFAQGYGTNAMGDASFAGGDQSSALGYSTFAHGANCMAGSDGAHAEGYSTLANEGDFYKVTAKNYTAKTITLDSVTNLAVGNKLILRGTNAMPQMATITAINGNVATIDTVRFGSWEQGEWSAAVKYDPDSGGASCHAEGWSTVASGSCSHAEGQNNYATGSDSHSEGYGTAASGYSGHAEGEYSIASGNTAHAQNQNTIAQGYAQTAIGKYNVAQGTPSDSVSTDHAFIIGNGTAYNARSNALTVDWAGNVNIPTGADYKINGVGLNSALNGKEPTITGSGATGDYWSGAKTWRSLPSEVRSTVLTGLSTATNAVITATDTVLSAFGKIQKQISDNLTTLTTHTGDTTAHTTSSEKSTWNGKADGWVATMVHSHSNKGVLDGIVTVTTSLQNNSDAVPSDAAVYSAVQAKQATLVSGTNIKTVNSTSLLGSGDIAVQPSLVSGTNIKTVNGNSLLGSGDLAISSGSTNVFSGTCSTANNTAAKVVTIGDGTRQPQAGDMYNITFTNGCAGSSATLSINGSTAALIKIGGLNETNITFNLSANACATFAYNGTYYHTSLHSYLSPVWGAITGSISSQTDLNTALSGKQATLVSGTNIKTVNGNSLLGSGDVTISGSVAWGNVTGTLSNQTDLNSALAGKSNTGHTHAESDITNLTTDLAAKQATLVSGTNIKTVNGTSLLGSGDLVVSGGSVAGKTYYVAKTGNNNNDGLSTSTPFLTITKAASVAAPGDTVLIRTGTYNERVACVNSGTAQNWITYQNYFDNSNGGVCEEVIIDGTGVTLPYDLSSLFDFNGQSYIKVEGLICQNATGTPYGCGIGDFSSAKNGNIIIKNCKTYNTGSSGVMFYYGHDIVVDGVWVDYPNSVADQEALTIYKVDNFEIMNCRLTRPRKEGIDCKDGCSNGKIHHNFIQDNTAPPCAAIYIDAGTTYCYNIDVYENIVFNSYMAVSIESEGQGDIENIYVRNNVIDDCWLAIQINGIESGVHVFDGVTIANNTITNYGRNKGFGEGWAGIRVRFPQTNLKIYGNTLYTPYSNSDLYAGLILPIDLSNFYSNGGSFSQITIDRNIVDRFNTDLYMTYPIGSNATFKNASYTTASLTRMNLEVGEAAYSTNENKPMCCVQKGVNHVELLTVNTGATSSGNITITISGNATTIPVTAGMTATQVATAIRNSHFGYFTTGSAGTTITFTHHLRGDMTSSFTLTANSTGVTGTFSVSVLGVVNSLIDLSSGGGGATWGSVTGTLSAQTDLQNSLNAKRGMAASAFFYETDFLYANVASWYPWISAAMSSGTLSTIAGEANHIGVVSFSSSTTANSGYYGMFNPSAILLAGGEWAEFIFKTPTSISATTNCRLGFMDSTSTTTPADGVYFNIVGTMFQGMNRTNTTGVITNTNYTLVVNTWYRARVGINADATASTFTLYNSNTGSQLWQETIPENIPTATGRETGHGYLMYNTGTTVVTLLHMDYMSMGINRILQR